MSPVLDVAARLLLVRLKGEAKLERREIVLFEKQPEEIVGSLKRLGIEVVICGAISQEFQAALQRVGVQVLAQICGEIEAVIAAYRAGKLNSPEFIMPGCCRQRWEAGRRGARCRKNSNSSRSGPPCYSKTR